MYQKLSDINVRPKPFEFYTAHDLWADEHTSKKMLAFHLNDRVELSSRNHQFIEESANWIINQFSIGPQSKVIDFGCGPGFYTRRFAKQQASVTGVDFSKSSIEYAQQQALAQGLDINYVHHDYLTFETNQKFDLATLIFCDYCALSPEQRKTLLGKIRDCLNENGHLLLDVYSKASFDQMVETATYEKNQLNNFWSANDYFSFLNRFKYQEELLSLEKFTIVEQARTRVVYNWLQHFTQDMLVSEFNQLGFDVLSVFNDVAGRPYHEGNGEFAVIAKPR